MRAITQDSVNAFLNRENFKKANMQVAVMGGKWYLKLHNNIIAVLHDCGTLMISNAGWFSNTTKERLNALPSVSIVQKNFVWYLNGSEWDRNLTEV